MQGRWLKIKKTWLLRAVACLLFLIFVGLVFMTAYVFKIADLWFFSFCICIGLLELVESIMFHFDSAFYFGSLLSLIGTSGFVFLFLSLQKFAIFFIAIAFALASAFTAVVYKQQFHLIIAFSIIFPTIYGYLFVKNLITLPIFIAFSVAFLLLLILGIITHLKGRR